MRVLVLNADDFGLDEGTNDAVAEAFKVGAISSASIMVPPEAFHRAAELAVKHSIPVGLHITLSCEKTLRFGPSRKEPRLSVDGAFPLYPQYHKADVADYISYEVTVQAYKTKLKGLQLTHFDAHIWCVPGKHSQFARAVEILHKETGLRFVDFGHGVAKTSNPIRGLGRIPEDTLAGKLRVALSGDGPVWFPLHISTDSSRPRRVAALKEIMGKTFRKIISDSGYRLVSAKELP